MALMIEESWLPATITHPPMSDAEFSEFCSEHPDLFFEMTAEGELLIMPPTHSLTGARNTKICSRLDQWAEEDGRGLCTDAAAGFLLPNGARRSPDAAWTDNLRLAAMSAAALDGYWHLCPNFVIELRSDSDRLATLRSKMREWIDNGAELGWLIDPERKAVEIFRPGCEPEVRVDIETIAGEGPVEGFILDLRKVWKPQSF